jgi:hypothetical protein
MKIIPPKSNIILSSRFLGVGEGRGRTGFELASTNPAGI